MVSSERFKTAVAPVGERSRQVGELRPVSFHLKGDPRGPVQHGLIAEEVAKVCPELVIHGPNGRIDGVRYDELAPLSLSEMQRQATEIQALKRTIGEMQAALANMQGKNDGALAHQ